MPNDDTEVDLGLNGVEPLRPGSSLVRSIERNCGGCQYSAKEGADRVCRFKPPVVQGFLVPGMVMTPKGPQQGMEMKTFTFFPIVVDTQWCGEYRRREQ